MLLTLNANRIWCRDNSGGCPSPIQNIFVFLVSQPKRVQNFYGLQCTVSGYFIRWPQKKDLVWSRDRCCEMIPYIRNPGIRKLYCRLAHNCIATGFMLSKEKNQKGVRTRLNDALKLQKQCRTRKESHGRNRCLDSRRVNTTEHLQLIIAWRSLEPRVYHDYFACYAGRLHYVQVYAFPNSSGTRNSYQRNSCNLLVTALTLPSFPYYVFFRLNSTDNKGLYLR